MQNIYSQQYNSTDRQRKHTTGKMWHMKIGRQVQWKETKQNTTVTLLPPPVGRAIDRPTVEAGEGRQKAGDEPWRRQGWP